MNRGGVNIEDVLNSYSDHLRCKLPKNADRFGCTRKSSRESAIVEAITFHILGAMGVSPEIHDQVGTGGVDFICRSPRQPPGAPQDRFVVEATSLSPDAVSERSHIPNEARNGISGFALGRVTQNTCNKAKGKHKQLGGYPMPRVLAIALAMLEHLYSSMPQQLNGRSFPICISGMRLGVTPQTRRTIRTFAIPCS